MGEQHWLKPFLPIVRWLMMEARLHNIEKHALQQGAGKMGQLTMLKNKRKKERSRSFFNSNKNKLKMD